MEFLFLFYYFLHISCNDDNKILAIKTSIIVPLKSAFIYLNDKYIFYILISMLTIVSLLIYPSHTTDLWD